MIITQSVIYFYFTFSWPCHYLHRFRTNLSFSYGDLIKICNRNVTLKTKSHLIRYGRLTIGEGNGTPLQHSCLENPMDGGAWWAAVHGVTKSRTRLSYFTFTFHFSLSCIGEGNGNPLQCSCLENPRDGGAWWAAVSGVTQSRTRLKRLSSSISSREYLNQFKLIR